MPREAPEGAGWTRAPPGSAAVASAYRRCSNHSPNTGADRGSEQARSPARLDRTDHPEFPQGLAPDDTVLHGYLGVPEGVTVCAAIPGGHEEGGLLGPHVRGHADPDRAAAAHRRPHLPPRLPQRRDHEAGEHLGHVGELRPHARVRQQGVHGADAPLPRDPLRPRGRQRLGPHVPPGRQRSLGLLPLPVGGDERPRRAPARAR
mmetsp:Transcript_37436/g.78425  ORF Transcript_37436/g.78425 Transcript_37436/m.78425 type:complete len:204 (+) Transcript_37436:317-928(+)